MPRSASITIHILLAVQILIPLHYYTCNSDERDERFAWRMFSPVRGEKCSSEFLVGDPPVKIRLSPYFHEAWYDNMAGRGRMRVIQAMAQRLCEDNTVVRVRVRCETSPGSNATETKTKPKPKPGEFGSGNRKPTNSPGSKDIEVMSKGDKNRCK